MRSSRAAFRTYTSPSRACTCSRTAHPSPARSTHSCTSACSRTAAPRWSCYISSWHTHHLLFKLLVGIMGKGDRSLVKRQGRFGSPLRNRPIPQASSMAPLQPILYYYHRRNPRPPPKTFPRPPPHGSPPRPAPKMGPLKGLP